MDNCLEKRIYDRQVNKQGMSDRVVDECNPDAHLSLREVTNLCWDDEEETEIKDFSDKKDKYIDIVMQKVVETYSKSLSKEPFQHESLLVDRKEKKLSQAEKRMAQRGYELEKQASARPSYIYNSPMSTQYRAMRTPDGSVVHRPVASVRPMQAEMGDKMSGSRPGGARPTRWIPAEVWQRQGMTAQEMTLPLDVVIPTSSAEKANIVLKAGQKVMVLKSPKGIYMQLETGKIIAIRTAFKMGQQQREKINPETMKKAPIHRPNFPSSPNIPQNLKNNSSITVTPAKSSSTSASSGPTKSMNQSSPGMPPGMRPVNHNMNRGRPPGGMSGGMQSIIKNRNTGGINKNIQLGTARPYSHLKQAAKLQYKDMKSSQIRKGDGDESSSSIEEKLECSEDFNDLSKEGSDDIIPEVISTNDKIPDSVHMEENAKDGQFFDQTKETTPKEISSESENSDKEKPAAAAAAADHSKSSSNDDSDDVVMVSVTRHTPKYQYGGNNNPYGMNYNNSYYNNQQYSQHQQPHQQNQQYPYYNQQQQHQQQQQYYPYSQDSQQSYGNYPPSCSSSVTENPATATPASFMPQTNTSTLTSTTQSANYNTPVTTPSQAPLAKNSNVTTSSITIDDDFDPPVRKEKVYKPNLVERKPKAGPKQHKQQQQQQQAAVQSTPLPIPQQQSYNQQNCPSPSGSSLKNYRHKASKSSTSQVIFFSFKYCEMCH